LPPVPDSLSRTSADRIAIYPTIPRRGGVIVAILPDDSASSVRCTWKGASTPCHPSNKGVRAFLPISADDSAGTFPFTIETPNGRITRQIVVEDYDFGRELILLPDSLFALVRRGGDIARDARSVRQVLSTMSREQRWTGRWRDLARDREKTSAYGIERFYARAADSSRSITLGPSLRAASSFGADSLSADIDLPGWRHTGIDIARARRSIVPAPAAGMVADVGLYTLMGRTVLVDHGLGVISAYFHLDTALVRRGDIVRAGQEIGRIGSTGLSTGPHLHYGIYVDGRDVEPALWHEAVAWMEGGTVARGRDTTRAAQGKAKE
jgi:murein DD-endopeptidase MepM/ murein hydrolase activator NlpD